MRAYEIEATIVALERTIDHAVKAGLGEHFVSDLQHLLATAIHNREDSTSTGH